MNRAEKHRTGWNMQEEMGAKGGGTVRARASKFLPVSGCLPVAPRFPRIRLSKGPLIDSHIVRTAIDTY